MSEQPLNPQPPVQYPDQSWASVQAEYKSWHPALHPHVERLLLDNGLGPDSTAQTPNPEGTETSSSMQVEKLDTVLENISKHIEIVGPGSADEPNLTEVTFVADLNDGANSWRRLTWGKIPDDYRLLDPGQPNDQESFSEASTALREDKTLLKNLAGQEGRWWIGTKSEKLVEENLKEIFRLHEGENHIDILNCSESNLSESEQRSLLRAFNAISNYTGGKIFSRVKGIVLSLPSEYPQGVAGDFNPATSTLSLNMSVLRNTDHADNLGRYAKYFSAGQTNWFEIVLAHELGHSIDINLLSEAISHGIDTDDYYWWGWGNFTQDFGAFDDKFGWEHRTVQTQKEGYTEDKTVHRMNDASELECREYSPTGYGRTNPREDFAETFAIACLGGDLSKLSQREEALKKTIQKAEGTAAIGSKLVTIEPITDPRQLITPIEKVVLKAYAAV